MDTTVRSEFGKDHGLIHEFVVTGRKVGAGEEFYSKLAHDEALFGQVVEMMMDGGAQAPGTTSVDEAAKIMGRNFHGAGDTNRHLDYSPTTAELNKMSSVPFSSYALQTFQDTHLLVWLAPMSLMDIWDVQTKLFYSKSDPWYGKRAERSWAKAKITAGWYLICKEEVPDSRSKTWAEQVERLLRGEEVPSAGVMAQAILIHFLETGERLFENVYVRTSSVGSDGGRVRVGNFDANGLYVYNWLGGRDGNVGLASSRKSS